MKHCVSIFGTKIKQEQETIVQFRNRMKQLRSNASFVIKKEWNNNLVSIYASIINEIEDDDEEQEKFFKSTAVLLGNLIR